MLTAIEPFLKTKNSHDQQEHEGHVNHTRANTLAAETMGWVSFSQGCKNLKVRTSTIPITGSMKPENSPDVIQIIYPFHQTKVKDECRANNAYEEIVLPGLIKKKGVRIVQPA